MEEYNLKHARLSVYYNILACLGLLQCAVAHCMYCIYTLKGLGNRLEE